MAQRYLLALDYADVHARNVILKHMRKRSLGNIEAKRRYVPLQPTISFRTVNVDVGASRSLRPRSTADIIDEQHSLIHELAQGNNTRNISSAPCRKRVQTAGPGISEQRLKLKKLYHVQLLTGRPGTCTGRYSPKPKPRPKSSALTPRGSSRSSYRRDTRSAACTPRDECLQDQVELEEATREHKKSKRQFTQRLQDHWDSDAAAINTGIYVRGKSVPGRADIESWLVFGGAQHKEADGVVGAFTMLDEADEFYNIDGGVGSCVAEKLRRGDKIRIGVNGVVHAHSLRVPREKEEESTEKKEEETGKKKEEEADDSNEIDALEKKLNELMQEESEEEVVKKKPVQLQPLSWEHQLKESNVKIVTPRQPSPSRESQTLCESHPVIYEKTVRDIPTHPKLPSEHFQGYRVNTRNFHPKRPPGWGDGQKVNVVTVDNTSQQMMEDLSVLSVDEVIRSALLAAHASRSPSPEAVMDGQRSESVNGRRKPGSAYSDYVSSTTTSDLPQVPNRLAKPSPPSISQTHQVDLSITTPGTVLGKTNLEAKKKHMIPPKSPMSPRVPTKIAYTSGAAVPFRDPTQGSEYIKITTQLNPGPDTRQGTPHSNVNYSSSTSFDERNIKLMSDRDYICQLMREQVEESEAVDFGGKPSSPASLRSESPPCEPTPARSSTPHVAPSTPSLLEGSVTPPATLLISIPTAADDLSDSASQHLVEDGEELTGPQRREKTLRDAHIDDITTMLAGAITPSKLSE